MLLRRLQAIRGGAAAVAAASRLFSTAASSAVRGGIACLDELRTVIKLEGSNLMPFLQRIVSNDVTQLAPGGPPLYACVLTAQGRFLHDLFLHAVEGGTSMPGRASCKGTWTSGNTRPARRGCMPAADRPLRRSNACHPAVPHRRRRAHRAGRLRRRAAPPAHGPAAALLPAPQCLRQQRGQGVRCHGSLWRRHRRSQLSAGARVGRRPAPARAGAPRRAAARQRARPHRLVA